MNASDDENATSRHNGTDYYYKGNWTPSDPNPFVATMGTTKTMTLLSQRRAIESDYNDDAVDIRLTHTSSRGVHHERNRSRSTSTLLDK